VPNSDGIDLDACRDVTVSDCHIRCGDDAICIKSTGQQGLLRQSSGIAVANCVLATPGNCFKIGTETFSDVENISVHQGVMSGIRDGGKWHDALAGVAFESVDGGNVRGVIAGQLVMDHVAAPVFVRRGRRHAPGNIAGRVTDISVAHVRARNASIPSSITGIPGFPVEDVSLSDNRIEVAGGDPAPAGNAAVPEHEARIPSASCSVGCRPTGSTAGTWMGWRCGTSSSSHCNRTPVHRCGWTTCGRHPSPAERPSPVEPWRASARRHV